MNEQLKPWYAIAAADVISERSNTGQFDEERGGDYRSEAIGAGLASAIYSVHLGDKAGVSF